MRVNHHLNVRDRDVTKNKIKGVESEMLPLSSQKESMHNTNLRFRGESTDGSRTQNVKLITKFRHSIQKCFVLNAIT